MVSLFKTDLDLHLMRKKTEPITNKIQIDLK
jgi:hypothetical protein